MLNIKNTYETKYFTVLLYLFLLNVLLIENTVYRETCYRDMLEMRHLMCEVNQGRNLVSRMFYNIFKDLNVF